MGNEQEKYYRFDERINKENQIFHKCDHIISYPFKQQQVLEEYYFINSNKISIIPPGINKEIFYPVSHRKLSQIRIKHKLRQHDVLLVGRLAVTKGFDLFIKCLPILQQIIPDIKAIIVASGFDPFNKCDLGVRLIKLAESLGVDDRIEWREYVLENEMSDIYRGVGVFVMPSRNEPWGLVALEAMACGTPTIITTKGGLSSELQPEIHALFIDPNNPVKLAIQISRVIQNYQLSRLLSREGSKIARTIYTWTNFTRAVQQVFVNTYLHSLRKELRTTS